jgi:methylphosphotriester-DNA--protein-cysteine methyltransferase
MKKVSDQVVEYILTRRDGELAILTTEGIASMLGVDLKVMYDTFEKDQKIPLERFITREKMHRAVFLLDKKKPITIDELAGKMGFPTSRQFALEFENYLLIEPQRYKHLVSG